MTTQSAATAGGSLKEVRPGVWRSRVVTGYLDGNKSRPKQHTQTYRATKREAQQRHAAHVAAVGAGAVSTATGTLGEYLAQWLDSRSATWKATTARRNATIVRQLPATLTAIRLRDLKPADVQRYVDRLSATSTPAGVRRVHAVLSGALSDAVSGEAEGLPRNPAAGRRSAGGSGIRLPVADVPEATPPEDDELNRVLGQAGLIDPGGLWADLYTFAAFTGLRRGELAALKWGDMNGLDSVTVRHSIETGTKATGGTWALTDTKSHASRVVPLAQRARRAVARRREAAGTKPKAAAFVFTEAADGSVPVHPDRISKVFAMAAAEAGVPNVKLKDLRSYAATVLASSAGLKVAQQFLGHRDVTTTARHYAGSRADATAAGLAALDAIAEPVAELTA
jgi:integrase